MAQGSRSFHKGELLEVVGELYRDKASGTLVLQREHVSKFLYVQDGDFIFAASNAPEDKFTQILLERGKLKPEQLALATEQKEQRTIGRTLVEMGFLGSEDLLEALVEQMRRIVRSALQWEEGLSVFKTGVLPANIAKLPILTPRFILDSANAIDDRAWVANTMGRMEAVISISSAERDVARAMPSSGEELRLLEQVDGRKTAREVCERAGVDSFFGAKYFLGLLQLGLIHFTSSMMPAAPSRAPSETVDLSFLDEIAPSNAPKAVEPSPAAAPSVPAETKPAPTVPRAPTPTLPLAPAMAPAPVSESASPLSPPSPPRTPPWPEEGDEFPAPPLFRDFAGTPEEEEGESDTLEAPPAPAPRVNTWRLMWLLLGAMVVVGVAAGVAWFLFLRPSQFIPVLPAIPNKPVSARPHGRPAGVPAPMPSEPAPAYQQAAAVPAPKQPIASPAPVQVTTPVAEPPKAPAPAAAPAKETKVLAPPSALALTPPPPQKPSPPPQNPPGGAAKESLASGKYAEAAAAFLPQWKASPAGYTVEIEVACQADTVAKGLAAAAGRDEYAILPFDLKGRSCFLVVWGSYPDKKAADDALKALPAFFLQNAQPKVVPRAKVLELSQGKR